MAPEYGATCGFFPVDEKTLDYMLLSGRKTEHVENVKLYLEKQGLFANESTLAPKFTSKLSLNLSDVDPAMAGPKRPQDRVDLSKMKTHFQTSLNAPLGPHGHGIEKSLSLNKSKISGTSNFLKHGDIVIAAITSCTNTSNPSVMMAAGLLARNARSKGLKIKPWVKPSLAPGSRVVTEYYDAAGLSEHLSFLGFNVVGYGCTTCIGNSGPLPENIVGNR